MCSNNIMEINGPTNVVRLEGKVNNIKKVIYVFFDFHIEPNFQTTCDNGFRWPSSHFPGFFYP